MPDSEEEEMLLGTMTAAEGADTKDAYAADIREMQEKIAAHKSSAISEDDLKKFRLRKGIYRQEADQQGFNMVRVKVATALGLPLTLRGEASRVFFITAHEDPAKNASAVNWEAVPPVGTVIIYIAPRNLDSTVEKLLSDRVSISKPVAVILGGTTSRQMVLAGTLEDIAAKPQGIPQYLHGLIVVGETVRVLSANIHVPAESAASIPTRERISYEE